MGFNMTILFPYIVCNLRLASVKSWSSRFSNILPHPDYSVESSFVLVASIPGSSIFHFLWEMPCSLMTQLRILDLCYSTVQLARSLVPCIMASFYWNAGF